MNSTKQQHGRAGIVLLGLLAAPSALQPLPAATLWGATASGIARQFEITCGTCPNPVSTLSSLSDGGFGSPSALADFSDPGRVAYFANAVLTGPDSLPHLGASATANIVVVSPSSFFFAASSVARATQMYTYTGSTTTDYTIQYDIDGLMEGGLLTEIAGGFTVFGSGFDPSQEGQPVLGFSFDHANGDGTLKPVHLSGTVTFTVNPGDNFFVQATLDTFADSRSQSMFASADASHTLTMGFTQGDTSLLIPAATDPGSSVPEPGTVLLAGCGLAGLYLATRLRRRSHRF